MDTPIRETTWLVSLMAMENTLGMQMNTTKVSGSMVTGRELGRI